MIIVSNFLRNFEIDFPVANKIKQFSTTEISSVKFRDFILGKF